MQRRRLTREESRERTRERLLEAAAEVIAKVGYASATVEEIAETAGFSRGAFYSNFSSKDELFLALIKKVSDAKHAMICAIFDEGGTPEALFEKLRVFYGTFCRRNGHFILWSEAKMHALRHSDFRNGLNALEKETRSQIAGYVGRYYKNMELTPTPPLEEIALALMALADGMALTQMLDPKGVPPATAEAVMMRFFSSVTAPCKVQ